MMSMAGEVAVTASTHNGTAWQPLPQLLSPNASLLLISSAIKFRAFVPDCNRALSTLEYRSAAPISPSVDEIARITVIVNDMGNYGCYNDCSTAEPVPLLAVSTIVIVNYGWLSHKWLLLRPGVLLGVATGIVILLIVMASVCAWLYLVNRLLSAQGKAEKNQQKHSFMTSLKTRWNFMSANISKPEDLGPQELTISSLGVVDGGLLKDESQQEDSATETADDVFTQDKTQGISDLEYVRYDTIDTYAKDRVPEDVAAVELPVNCWSQDISATSGASDVFSGDGMHHSEQSDVVSAANEALDVISRYDIHDYAQAEYAAIVGCQCPCFSHDKSTPSEAIHAPALSGYVPSIDSLENNCPTTEAIYDPLSGSDFQSSDTDRDFQATNKVDTIDHNVDDYSIPGSLKADGHTLPGDWQSSVTVQVPLEGIGYCGSDGDTLPDHLEAADQQILPINESETTSMANQIDGMPFFLPSELDYEVYKEGMQHLGYSMLSRVSLFQEESPESRSLSANLMPASVSSSFIDNRSNQQNVEDNQGCNDRENHNLESYENTADYQPSAVKLEAANRSQNEYPNQLNNKGVLINDLLSSTPFGDSSSSSQSCTSTEEGNVNLKRTMPIKPMIDTHGKLEEDVMCALNTNTSNPSVKSYPAELFEEMSQMPELKVVLELPEASSLDEDMDLLDHINLVFSSLETDADGTLVAVLSQSV